MKSFRTKMTILIILAMLGSSVLLSFISYQRAKRSLIDQMEDNYDVAAEKYALELSSWISNNATIIDTMAAEIAVNNISDQGYDAFHKYLKHSNELLNKNGYIYDVYFTYPDNTMVCASDFIADGSVDFVHEREWYTTSALTGTLFYSTPYLDSDTQKTIITISKAVYRDGELLGVLAADIFVDVLVSLISDANIEADSYAFLLDQNMRVLVHPYEKYKYEDKPHHLLSLENSPYKPLVDAIINHTDEMVYITDYDNITRGIVSARMINTGWYVCIATDRDKLSEGVISMMIGFVIATIISIVIGTLAAVFLARVLDKLSKQEQDYRQRVLKLEKLAADEANAAKSRFLADMSHEIRTPINAIIGMNEMILRESDNPEIRDYSKNIKQSGHNLLQLINGILDFSKIEDGKMDIVPVTYNVSKQIGYLRNSISERAKAKGLELVFNIDKNIPSELYGDDTRINQIIMNLLTNAVKYTEEGSVILNIEGKEKRQSDDGEEIKLFFEVRDTGIGIRQEDMKKLFESFERLDVVKNRNIEGTGLGMNITAKLLALMDSELKVDSEYGKGSTFSFYLWQKIENDQPIGDYNDNLHNENEEYGYKESFYADKARILVVDDTEMNILVVKNLLKKTRIQIDTALNGPDSIALADKNSYDIILMDQRMPEMDGTEAMCEIRSLESKYNHETPIICLTADVVRGAKEKYLNMGFNDYLTKPVDGTELEKMLIQYLPADKIELVKRPDSNETDDKAEIAESDDTLIHELRSMGIDTDSGLKYCGDDPDIYISILDAFATEAQTKSVNIEKSYKYTDWKNYGIYVHSLKSTAKTIGAIELFEMAAELEDAAKTEDTDIINKNHDKVMKLYSDLVEIINKFNKDNSDTENDDFEVLEFMPE